MTGGVSVYCGVGATVGRGDVGHGIWYRGNILLVMNRLNLLALELLHPGLGFVSISQYLGW